MGLNPREAREIVREVLQECPNCGGVVVFAIHGDDEVMRLSNEIHRIGGRYKLARVEDMESKLRAGTAFTPGTLGRRKQ